MIAINLRHRMKHLLRAFFLFLMLGATMKSHALSCNNGSSSGGGAIDMYLQIPSVISVAPELPAGTEIWRSSELDFNLKCWQETYLNAPQDIYLYFQPEDLGGALLGPTIELGISWFGTDYTCASMNDGGYCRIKTRMTIPPCTKLNGCMDNPSIFLPTKIRFFIKKKTSGHSISDWDDTLVVPGATSGLYYTAVKFDGAGGPSGAPNARVKVKLGGLEKLRYMGCPSTVDIDNRLIKFKPALGSKAEKNLTIDEVPVTITTSKSCTVPYGIDGFFSLTSGNLVDNDATLVPIDNESVGIQLIRPETGTPLKFRQIFELAPEKNTLPIHKTKLLARLFWRQNTAILGAFSASAKLNVYYK